MNPKDPRYAHLIGKHVVRPLPAELPREQKLIPIIGDEHVDFEFGTGVLKVTPAHDKADFEIGQRHKLAVDGHHESERHDERSGRRRLARAGPFRGPQSGRGAAQGLGRARKEEPYENNVGFSQRADVPIEPRLSEQWFLKYPCAESREAASQQATMKLHPSAGPTTHAAHSGWSSAAALVPVDAAAPGKCVLSGALGQGLRSLDGNIQDWCISRQLWWGHRIPVWYRKPEAGPSESTATSNPPQRSRENWTQDPDVLDTWFSSWLWPFATMGWPEQTPTLEGVSIRQPTL